MRPRKTRGRDQPPAASGVSPRQHQQGNAEAAACPKDPRVTFITKRSESCSTNRARVKAQRLPQLLIQTAPRPERPWPYTDKPLPHQTAGTRQSAVQSGGDTRVMGGAPSQAGACPAVPQALAFRAESDLGTRGTGWNYRGTHPQLTPQHRVKASSQVTPPGKRVPTSLHTQHTCSDLLSSLQGGHSPQLIQPPLQAPAEHAALLTASVPPP